MRHFSTFWWVNTCFEKNSHCASTVRLVWKQNLHLRSHPWHRNPFFSPDFEQRILGWKFTVFGGNHTWWGIWALSDGWKPVLEKKTNKSTCLTECGKNIYTGTVTQAIYILVLVQNFEQRILAWKFTVFGGNHTPWDMLAVSDAPNQFWKKIPIPRKS